MFGGVFCDDTVSFGGDFAKIYDGLEVMGMSRNKRSRDPLLWNLATPMSEGKPTVLTKQERARLERIYDTVLTNAEAAYQVLARAGLEATARLNSDRRLDEAIERLGRPDPRTPEGRAQWKRILEERRQTAEENISTAHRRGWRS